MTSRHSFPINPRHELFKWGPMRAKLFYVSLWAEAIYAPRRSYGRLWPPYLALFDRGTLLFVTDFAALRAAGRHYFARYFLNERSFSQHWQRWQAWVRRYQGVARGLDRVDWPTLTRKALRNVVAEFYQLNLDCWYIVQVPEIANWGGEAMLHQELTRLDPKHAQQHLEVLAAPVQPSFLQVEELDLLRLAKLRGTTRYQPALEPHANRYRWLLNSYGGSRVLTASYFDQKLRDLLKAGPASARLRQLQAQLHQRRAQRRALMRKLKLSGRVIRIADQLAFSIWWQDLRKSYVWKMQDYWDILLREVSRQTNEAVETLQWMWAYEVVALLDGHPVDRKLIRQRAQAYVQVGQGGRIREYVGAQVVAEVKRRYVTTARGSVRVLHGLVVSRGDGKPVTGKVKIIRDPFVDVRKMRRGDILVASMTEPEYIVAMRKAAAVVTDHGGMISHAAIVSRELGIPCIVNTQVATQVLRDGDRVELDPTRGVVRKLHASQR